MTHSYLNKTQAILVCITVGILLSYFRRSRLIHHLFYQLPMNMEMLLHNLTLEGGEGLTEFCIILNVFLELQIPFTLARP